MTLAVLAGLATSCATPSVGEVSDGTRVRVYLLRGLWDVFSLGLDVLARELESETVSAVSVSGSEWPSLAAEIEGLAARAGGGQGLVLVGHSYGADDAVKLARALNEQGVEVPLLILLDATDPAHIPPNVGTCIHYYIPTDVSNVAPDVFAGNPVEPTPGNTRSVIINQVVSTATLGEAVRMVDHFNIDSSVFLHAQIEELIDALAAEAGP